MAAKSLCHSSFLPTSKGCSVGSGLLEVSWQKLGWAQVCLRVRSCSLCQRGRLVGASFWAVEAC